MQHKKIFPLFFLFLLLSVLVISFIPQVKATSYEWLQNNSFENVGAGSSTYNATGDAFVFDYSGSRDTNYGAQTTFLAGYNTAQRPGYITFPIDEVTADVGEGSVINATMSLYCQLSTQSPQTDLNISVYAVLDTWSESTLTWNNQPAYSSTFTSSVIIKGADYEYHWVNFTVTGNIANGVINGNWFGYRLYGANNSQISTIYSKENEASVYRPKLTVYYSGVGGEQETVNANTLPWYSGYEEGTGINMIFGHTGTCSYYGNYYPPNGRWVYQRINNLDSDLVTSVSLWAYTTCAVGVGSVKVMLFYGDGSYSEKTVIMNTSLTWESLIFSNFVLPNKAIRMFAFVIMSGEGAVKTNIDDVSMLASVPAGQTVFSFSLSPVPVSSTSYSFIALQKTAYTFTGYVYNGSGLCVDNGVYNVVSVAGSHSGNIVNGVFSFLITPRFSSGNLTENFIITVNANNTFTILIGANWLYVGGDGGDGGDGGYDTWYTNMVVTYMILFIFIIVPPLIIAFEFSKHDVDPFMGFIGGLCLTVPIAYIVHIIDLWVLFVFVLGLILMILAKLGVLSRI